MSRAAVFETFCLRHGANMALIKQFQRLRQVTLRGSESFIVLYAADSAF